MPLKRWNDPLERPRRPRKRVLHPLKQAPAGSTTAPGIQRGSRTKSPSPVGARRASDGAAARQREVESELPGPSDSSRLIVFGPVRNGPSQPLHVQPVDLADNPRHADFNVNAKLPLRGQPAPEDPLHMPDALPSDKPIIADGTRREAPTRTQVRPEGELADVSQSDS